MSALSRYSEDALRAAHALTLQSGSVPGMPADFDAAMASPVYNSLILGRAIRERRKAAQAGRDVLDLVAERLQPRAAAAARPVPVPTRAPVRTGKDRAADQGDE